LGNLGDFIGGLAVVVTLIYLTLQVRQNTKQSERSVRASQTSAFHQSQQQLWDSILTMAKDPVLASIVSRGAEDLAALSDEERGRMYLVLVPMLGSLEIQLYLYESGEIGAEPWELAWKNSAPFVSQPGILEIMSSRQGRLSERLYELLKNETDV
jgi:hypothetical protein